MSIRNLLHELLRVVLILLVASCVFDPGNKILGIKMQLFILCWIIFIVTVILKNKEVYVSNNLIFYLLLFIIVIPIVSILYFISFNGDFRHFSGWLYYKPYLFLSITIILYQSKINPIIPTIKILTLLSIITLIIFIIGYFNNSFFTLLESKIGGGKYDLARIGIRDFSGMKFPMVYFESSPLIVFSIGYFTYKFTESKGINKISNLILLAINVIAMFVGATRNNMITSVLTTIVVMYWYSRKKILLSFFVITVFIIFFSNSFNALQKFFDKNETSNKVKISFYNDYMDLFHNPKTLIFGQGLGSYFNSPRGYVSSSELTYFEIIRRFGLVLSFFIFSLLLYPIYKLSLKSYHNVQYIYISYFFYLIICFTNPLLLSSTGMLFLSIVLYTTF